MTCCGLDPGDHLPGAVDVLLIGLLTVASIPFPSQLPKAVGHCQQSGQGEEGGLTASTLPCSLVCLGLSEGGVPASSPQPSPQ